MESGATLTNGTITRCSSGVAIRGAGSHTVTRVKARSNSTTGFAVFPGSNGNTLTHNTARNNGEPKIPAGSGFMLASRDNVLEHNVAIGNGADGFAVFRISNPEPRENRFRRNFSKENAGGFNIISSGELAKNNVALVNRAFGFRIVGDQNEVVGNLASRNGNGDFPEFSAGFLIQGTDITVFQNIATRSLQQGFRLESGNHYTLNRNIALRNGKEGIQLVDGAMDSTLRGNLALDNKGTDLVDDNFPDCDDNNWSFNFFRTRNQTCIR